jgi:phosphorylcholine metabolism protein LicD
MTNALSILKEVYQWKTENHLPLWLDQGALLGAIRDHKLIENDSDIDICFLFKNAKTIINNLYSLHGFKIKFDSSDIYLTKNNVIVDLKGYQSIKDQQYYFNIERLNPSKRIRWQQLYNICQYRSGVIGKVATFEFHCTKNRVLRRLIKKICTFVLSFPSGFYVGMKTPKYFYDTLNTIVFSDMVWDIPSDTETYLEYKYGVTWCTPNRKWNFYTDDGGMIQQMKLPNNILLPRKTLYELI